MLNSKYIEVVNSWMITAREIIIADLKHTRQGLPAGTKVISGKSKLAWEVKHRLTCNHVNDKHKKFANESELLMWFSFGTIEKMEESASDILKGEAEGVFQYQLVPIGHKNKPETGEVLEIVE